MGSGVSNKALRVVRAGFPAIIRSSIHLFLQPLGIVCVTPNTVYNNHFPERTVFLLGGWALGLFFFAALIQE